MIIRKTPYTVRSGSAYLMQMDPGAEKASIMLYTGKTMTITAAAYTNIVRSRG